MTYILSITLLLGVANAEQKETIDHKQDVKTNEQLSHKYRMAGYLLSHAPLTEKIQSSGDKVANELLTRAKRNYSLVKEKIDQRNWLEANAMVDSVLRDLNHSAQLLNRKNIKSAQYREQLRRIDSFALPVWKDMTKEDELYLEKSIKKIKDLSTQAENQASSDNYDHAIALLEKAYKIKISLIKKLKHEETIIYDLMFDSVEEEYTYMVNRTKHFIELVNMAIAINELDPQTRTLIKTYVFQGKISLRQAQQMEHEGRHAQAINILTESVNELSNALKIIGIKI